jgi:hypothetical protein
LITPDIKNSNNTNAKNVHIIAIDKFNPSGRSALCIGPKKANDAKMIKLLGCGVSPAKQTQTTLRTHRLYTLSAKS